MLPQHVEYTYVDDARSRPGAAGALRQNLLIVEDSVASADALRALLETNYRVTCAYDGEHAIGFILNDAFDLILLDVELPGISGFGVCEAIRKSKANADTPIIFLSGLESRSVHLKGLETGAVDFLVKPVSPIFLQRKIENQLRVSADWHFRDDFSYSFNVINRQSFDAQLAREVQRAQRKNDYIALALLEFEVNAAMEDTDGRYFSSIMSSAFGECSLRGADVVAQVGKWTFAILLPQTDRPGTINFMRRLYTELSKVNGVGSDNGRFGVRGGLVSRRVDAGDSSQRLIALASRALAKAGVAGGARFVLA